MCSLSVNGQQFGEHGDPKLAKAGKSLAGRRAVTRSRAIEGRCARYFSERLDNFNKRAGTIGFFWSASLTTESGMAEFTRSGRPRLDKERLPFLRPTAMINSRARRLYRGVLTVLSPSSLPRLPQLRGIQGKPPKLYAGKRKEHAGGSTVRTSAARASPQRWAMEGWRDGGLDTVSGGETFALYRVRGRCGGRAQNPGHRPPHTLISTDILARRPLDPASPASRKKSGQKSLTPLPRCNPIVSRLPLPPGPLERQERA